MAVATLLFMMSLLPNIYSTEAKIGVCYGRIGNNLPMEKHVVDLYKSNGIGAMRLYDPDVAVLKALKGSGITLMLGVPNENLQALASHQLKAVQWVQTNVVPFASTIKYIVVGNEIHPSDKQASSVLPAMQNILKALNSKKLNTHIKVSTSIDTSLTKNTYPPSKGQFSNTSYMTPIIRFLSRNRSPLLVNVYTYFSYIGNKQSISLKYALFTSNRTVVNDPQNGKNYQNLFDAIVDSVYAALKKVGAPNMEIVVSETGWPSGGGDAATVGNARAYYRNLINHVKKGTPMRPRKAIETYLFAMFDEDMKPGAKTERHFGLFTPANKLPKYGKLDFK